MSVQPALHTTHPVVAPSQRQARLVSVPCARLVSVARAEPPETPFKPANTVRDTRAEASTLDEAILAWGPQSASLTESGADGELGAWLGRYLVAAVEIAAGRRPPAQLARWSSPEVMFRLTRRHHLNRTTATGVAARAHQSGERAGAPQLRSLRVYRIGPTTLEVCAVVALSGRGRAVAGRVLLPTTPRPRSQRNHSWPRVIALDLG